MAFAIAKSAADLNGIHQVLAEELALNLPNSRAIVQFLSKEGCLLLTLSKVVSNMLFHLVVVESVLFFFFIQGYCCEQDLRFLSVKINVFY